MLIKQETNHDKTTSIRMQKWAVVGATDNKDKFGFKIYRKLKDHGYEVYPVNPGVTEILGDKCYASLEELPVKVEVVDFVVNEKIGLTVLQDMVDLGIQTAWLQPGADSKAVIARAQELGITPIQACVLVALAATDH